MICNPVGYIDFMRDEMSPRLQMSLLGFAIGFVLMMVLDVVLG